ncbi:hypothetical protein [Halopiger goleimassiliensis]|uniref:hypothetical protein n=1 Tax=Halopiger goleimassiliensis TaxID=1293048 RepID=UPI0006780C7D|nr:hypothetical protein [Halopiger goleimassiliensis]
MGRQFEDGWEWANPSDDAESVEELLGEMEQDTRTVVEQLRESGPRRHVSDSSVDDVFESLEMDEEGSDDDDSELSGEPTRRVSTTGIDEVFEQLEAEVNDETSEHGARDAGDEGDRSDAAVSRSSTPLPEVNSDRASFDEVESSVDDEFGSLAGDGPTRTVSDENVDDVLESLDEPTDGADEPAGNVEALRPADPEAALADLIAEPSDEPDGEPDGSPDSVREAGPAEGVTTGDSKSRTCRYSTN